MIYRELTQEIFDLVNDFPAIAILGPRQSGKSTLAKYIISQIPDSIYLDLEDPEDIEKLSNPKLYFTNNSSKLICLDEIQRLPGVFELLRSIIDNNNRNGQFLFLGSASPDLLKQTSESLAGRIVFLELSPFTYNEVQKEKDLSSYWFNGGFPRSLLASSTKASRIWRNSFIQTFLERDIIQFGFKIPPTVLRRLWQMCAHSNGQVLNSSKIGDSLGLTHNTVKKYIDILSMTYMLRVLPPFEGNMKKRLIKSPKLYVRDTGILHSLLQINDFNQLLGHPTLGSSWETLVIENIIRALPSFYPYFYRTSNGAEIDLILKNGTFLFAIECKVSMSPKPTKGFWLSVKNLNPNRAYIAAPVSEEYQLEENIYVGSFNYIIEDIRGYIKQKEQRQNNNYDFISKLNKI